MTEGDPAGGADEDPADDGGPAGGGESEGEGVDRRLRRDPDRPALSADQRAVFDAYFADRGTICTPAGSGTGKTSTAVEVVAEAVVRELERDPERNPFESILVTTFTRDAARQLKTDLKERLREHRAAAPPDDPVVRRWGDLLRWLETASHVRTIDSFTNDLLREVALDAGVAPSFGVADGIRRSDLLEETFADLRGDPDLAGPIDRLSSAFPPDGDGESWEEIVVSVHRNCREFGWSVAEAREQLRSSVEEMHPAGEPGSFGDLLATVAALTDYDADFVRHTVSDRAAWVEHARETYRASRRLADDFGTVLAAFDRRYDAISRSQGSLSHTDITYVVRQYLEGDPPAGGRGDRERDRSADRRERWRESLAGRFRHVVVDEFQDTDYAQCRILAHLLGPETRALLIGDLKQSIYEWRSAEPRLFARVVDYAHGRAEDNVLDADAVRPVGLAENFRSHPHLVRVANHVFPRIFADPGRGGIGTFEVDYEPLSAERVETQPDEAHVHVLRLESPDTDEDDDRSRREALVEREAERVAGTLRAALDRGTLRVDRDRQVASETDDPAVDGADLDPVRPGDVAVLFRTRTHMRTYSRVLDEYGIENAVIGTGSLFQEPEIEALVDALSWVGRPDDRDALARLVESPVVALSAAGTERLAECGHDLDAALAAWPDPGDGDGDPDRDPAPDGEDRTADRGERAELAADRRELEELARLREDLRPERDGSKAQLVCDLLAHSAFDVAALGDRDGLQRYANLRRFLEVVDDWEADDHLSFGEFMRRLGRLRAGRVEDETALADIADMDSEDTVKLLTAHTAKGLEFPVVVLADTTRNEAYGKVCDEPFLADRRHGLALRPSTGASSQPDDGEFPTFEGGWFHEDDSGYALDRGLLWVSEVRGDDGRIRHDHPFRGYVQDRRAEFWRLLYVAMTRAGDHLVVPLADPGKGTAAEWATWAGALAEHLDPGPDGVLETDDGDVPVGVDDLPAADPPGGVAVDLADLLDPEGVTGSTTTDGTGSGPDAAGGPADEVDAPAEDRATDPDRRFVPPSLTPTTADALLSSPDRFQRAVLHGLGAVDDGTGDDSTVPEPPGRIRELRRIDPAGEPASSARGSPASTRESPDPPSGADPGGESGGAVPDGLAPEEWGDAVHAALAGIHGSDDPARTLDRVVDGDPGTLGRVLDGESDPLDRVFDGDPGVLDRAVGVGSGSSEPTGPDGPTAPDDPGEPAPHREDARRALRRTLSAYAGSDAWAAARDADERFPEFEVAAPLPVEAPGDGTVLRGRIDLLYGGPGGWGVVDVKTGRAPDPDDPASVPRSHRVQVAAYAWLLSATYGIDPAECRLVYPGNPPVEILLDPDPAAFEDRLAERIAGLWVDADGALRSSARD